MATRLYSVIFDAADLGAQARFWSEATGWPIVYDAEDEKVVEPPDEDANWIAVAFVPVDDPKVGKNRVHLDLASTSEDHQAEIVSRLLEAGAVPVDVGQQDVPWVVLADPEGNELCVLEPRDEYARAGAVAAVVLDATDPGAAADFWAAASGWPVVAREDSHAALAHPSGIGPRLEIVRVDDPKVAKNRVHTDVAPAKDDDQAAEVARLKALGAADADVGQGDDNTWVVLADPLGNEFCVLSPRD